MVARWDCQSWELIQSDEAFELSVTPFSILCWQHQGNFDPQNWQARPTSGYPDEATERGTAGEVEKESHGMVEEWPWPHGNWKRECTNNGMTTRQDGFETHSAGSNMEPNVNRIETIASNKETKPSLPKHQESDGDWNTIKRIKEHPLDKLTIQFNTIQQHY